MSKQCRYEKRIIKERNIFLIFALLSFVAPAIAFFVEFRPEQETLNSWFQRSGSAMVILALLAEMRAYQMFDVFKPAGIVADSFLTTKEKYSWQVTVCNVAAFILIACGTIIWGYGDLLV